MNLLLLYVLITIELISVSLYYFVMSRKRTRRISDIILSVIFFFFSISYLFYGLEYLNFKTKSIQTILDMGIAILIAILFIKQMLQQINNSKSLEKK